MYKTRVFFRLFLLVVFSLLLSLLSPSLIFAREAPSLPEMPHWICGELKTTNLDTVSGNQGTWFQRDYRSASGERFHAALFIGKGAGTSGFQSASIDSNDGLIGSGSTYRTFEIRGCQAIAETHPVLGTAVAVKLADGYLTLESGPYGMSSENLTDAASELISSM